MDMAIIHPIGVHPIGRLSNIVHRLEVIVVRCLSEVVRLLMLMHIVHRLEDNHTVTDATVAIHLEALRVKVYGNLFHPNNSTLPQE